MSDTKKYLIIGASSGVGSALLNVLTKEQHQVITASRREVSGSYTHLPLDITKEDLNVSLLPDSLDGLVYCPGSINLKPFHRITDQEFMEEFNLNVIGAIKVVRSVLPLLKNSQHASIVFFSTIAVQQGMPFHASVAAAKGALEGLTRSLAAEFAPKIRVNCIAPSLTNTPLAARLLSSDEKKKASDERHPLKRVGEADDIAQLAAFLLSPQSSWITGQIIHADGGLSTIRM
jgi:NAD(P)-dependent dehydrogenase (short-subunit alcohol dehydrogenase family)